MLWVWLTAAWALEWRAQLGGEINADPHGTVDFGVRDARWSVQWLTDTLDIRATPSWDTGRGWVAARSEFGAAGLFISPWTDGAPDPAQALTAFYAGGEGGAVHYLPHGLYIGGQATLRSWWFARAGRQTDRDIPLPRPVLSPDLLLGLYRNEGIDAWVRVGLDWQPGLLAPHVQGRVTVAPQWMIAPTVVVNAGWAHNQDAITRTRLGGMNPYVVPVAGAAWAEWWVEDYAAIRLGPVWQTDRTALSVTSDLAWFDGQTAAGFESRFVIRDGRRSAAVAVGYAPWIPRPERHGRTAVFFQLGWDWGKAARKARVRELAPTASPR